MVWIKMRDLRLLTLPFKFLGQAPLLSYVWNMFVPWNINSLGFFLSPFRNHQGDIIPRWCHSNITLPYLLGQNPFFIICWEILRSIICKPQPILTVLLWKYPGWCHTYITQRMWPPLGVSCVIHSWAIWPLKRLKPSYHMACHHGIIPPSNPRHLPLGPGSHLGPNPLQNVIKNLAFFLHSNGFINPNPFYQANT